MMDQPLLELDRDGGRVSFPTGRAFILGRDTWLRIKATMDHDPALKSAVSSLWVEYGRRFGLRMRELLGNEMDILFSTLEDTAREAGWGVFKVEGDRGYGTHLTVRVKNCVFCDGMARVQEPVCYEVRGVIEGAIESIIGKRSVKEVCCSGRGEPYCEFEISL